MNLLFIGAGIDFNILKLDLKVSLYFFVDSRPQSTFPVIEKNFVQNVKHRLKNLGWIKIKRYEFKAICSLKEKYHCDGVLLYRSKDYSKFLYYFYSTTLPNKKDHPVYQFIEKSDAVFVNDVDNIRTVIHAISNTVSPSSFIIRNGCPSSSLLLTENEKKVLSSVENWYLFDGVDKLHLSSYEEIFEEFGFNTTKTK